MVEMASDDLRSLNAQIEFLLRCALQDAGRLSPREAPEPPDAAPSSEEQ
jgi:hypothetical protein